MRLIDADELRKHAFKTYQSNGVALEPYKVVPLGCIDNAPTVEQPQGEWHWNEQGYFYCNKCDRQPRDQYAVTNYCPNCGAKMT